MEIGNHLVEGLVDISASMSIMSIVVVYELSIMHLVFGFESYKTTSGVMTQMLGKITKFCGQDYIIVIKPYKHGEYAM